MNKKEYLSEEKYQKIKKILITLGFISLAVGVILLVLAILVKVPEEPSLGDPNWWGNSKISSDAESKKALLFFFSFVFGIMLPAMLFGTAYKREIKAFNTQQEMPVKQETIEKMAPSVGEAAGTVVKGIKKGLKDEE